MNVKLEQAITAVQNGLKPEAAAAKYGVSLEELSNALNPNGAGAPVDGYESTRTPEHSYTLKSGRKVNVYRNPDGKQVFEYTAADGTKMNEAEFLKAEGLTGRHFAVDSKGQLVHVKDAPSNEYSDRDIRYTMRNGRYIVYNRDSKTGEETFKFYEKDGTEISEADFRKKQGVGDKEIVIDKNGALTFYEKSEPFFNFTDENGDFSFAETGKTVLKTILSPLLLLTSCRDSDDVPVLPDINISNGAVVNITIPPQDQSALINAFKEGIDALLAKIDELQAKLDEMGLTLEEFKDQVIQLLVQNNAYLKTISEQLEQLQYKQDEIIEILTNINSTVQTISSLVEATNENIIINGESVKEQLTEILNEIKNGNINSIEKLEEYMNNLTAMLQTIIQQQGDQIEISEDSNMTLDQILEILGNLDAYAPEDKLEAILEILQSIESIGKDISSKLDAIISMFESAFPDNDEIKAALERIEEYIKQNNDKTDVTNNLLQQLLEQYNSGGISQEDLQKLLDAIAANGDKIDATNQLLAKIQNQDEKFQKQVLELLANVGPDYSEVLNKILEATQGNSAKLDAIAQLLAKIQGQDEEFQKIVLDYLAQGGTDYTEILNKILEATQGNSAKLDAIAQLLAKIQGQDEEFQKIVLDYIAQGGTDYTEILNKILEAAQGNSTKLDAIAQLLAKIQNQDEKFQQQVLELLAKVGPDYSEVLNKILEATQGNSAKLDAIAQLLAKMQGQDEEFQKNVLNILNNMSPGEVADYTEILNKILEATQGNSAKLDAIAQLLAKIQDQDAEFQKNVLNAIDQLGIDIAGELNNILSAIKNISGGGGDTSSLEALLNKVLEKMDSNTAAIIEAIGKIKPGTGGTVDLSSLEEMLSKLLELASKNNGLLESIDGKMDVINLTIEAAKDEIIAHLGNGGGDVDVSAILAKLDEFMELSNSNSEAILAKMDTIINLINNIKDSTYDDTELMNKLDDILAAIKDHNITVDITGKVTCNCNCGGNHEGILGDLEDVLG